MDADMLDTARHKPTALLLLALLLGSSAGWYLGKLFGLNADQWFIEPESDFELLTGLIGFACGALLAFTSNKSLLLKMLGAILASGFALTIIAYGHYSSDVPSHEIGTTLYLPELLIQTFGGWFSPILGAITVLLLRIISR